VAGSGDDKRYKALLKQLEGLEPLPQRPVSLLYRLGLAAVSLMAMLLPLVYVGLIGLFGYTMFWFATEYHPIFFERGSMRASTSPLAIVILYFGPLFVGSVLILFMIKPLFANRLRPFDTMALVARDEPGLFGLVAHISRLVHAPMPNEIRVSYDVNASASLRRGMRSLFRDDLTLTIGLPLVAGLSQQQLAGVLAHELGHFSQQGGLRMSFVVRSINAWLARVVYERDRWDHWLYETAATLGARAGLVLWVAILFLWITRKILWLLMMAGHLISCSMLRQMEFDADRSEIQLAGSRCFATTTERIRVLSVAATLAAARLERDLKAGAPPPDNWPVFLARTIDDIPGALLRQIHQEAKERSTGWLDTHPSDRDRIEASRRLGAKGLFASRRPASELLSNWPALSRMATLDYYGRGLGLDVDPHKLRSIKIPEYKESPPEASPTPAPASPKQASAAAKPRPPEPSRRKPPPPMPKG